MSKAADKSRRVRQETTPPQVTVPVPSPDKGGGLGGGVQIPPPVKPKRRTKSNVMSNDIIPCRLGRRPAIQGPRPQLRNRGWVEKSTTGMTEARLQVATEQMKIGTWNVQTLASPGKLELLRIEMAPYACDILGLSEMHWTGVGELNGGEVIWSGEVRKHVKGVGFLLSKRAKEALLGYNPVNSRIIAARFSGKPLNIAAIQVYAPTTDSADEEVEEFYEQIERTIEDLPKKDVKIVIGDWNAKVGMDRVGWEHVMGQYGYGQRNERGERLLEFAAKNDLFITNTRFQQKDSRKWTWMAPDGKHTNMIDLVLIDRRWKTAVRVCRTFQGADISSDHSLVMCKLKLRLKRIPREQRHEPRGDVEALRNDSTRAAFRDKVKEDLTRSPSQIAALEDRVQRLNKVLQGAVKAILPTACKPNKPWITVQTLQLSEKKRKLKQRRQETSEKEKEYKRMCNVVRKAARTDKEEWIQRRCQDIEELAGGNRSREAYKLINQINRAWKPKQSAIKDKNGKMLQDKAEVKKRWTEYCSGLYTDGGNNEAVVNELDKISPPPNEDEQQDILYEEVAAAVKRLKKGKSPGIDSIAGEVIQAGGEKVTEEIHSICNQIWQEGRVPEEWTKSVIVTIPKKGDLADCSNYRTIALLSHISKVLLMVLLERLKAQVEPYLSEEQAGFRRDRSTVQQILILRLIAEKAKRKGRCILNCFIDFRKAFDSIKHDIIWATLRSYGVGKRLTDIMRNICETSQSAVRIGGELGEWFRTSVGTRQGDPISPTTFITYLERIMDAVRDNGTGVSVQGHRINNLKFADDIDLLEEDGDDLQRNLDQISEAAEAAGLQINIEKTMTMVFGQEDIGKKLEIGGRGIENVTEFVYLGSLLTWDNDCNLEIKRRIARATGVMAGFKTIWRSMHISTETKIRIVRTCVMSVLLYACETWTMRKKDKDSLLAFEMRCYRRILHIYWQQKISNTEVRRRVGSTKNIVQVIMERKLRLFGHISRMEDDRLVKNVLFGTMEGQTRRGRPSREWLDDIKEWCQSDIYSLSKVALDRSQWKEVIRRALGTNGRKPME